MIKYPSENTTHALQELLALGLHPTTFLKIGSPDIIEVPSSIAPDLTEKIEEIMKRHNLVRVQHLRLVGHSAVDDQTWKYAVPLTGRLYGAYALIAAAEQQLSQLRSEFIEAEGAAVAADRPTNDQRLLRVLGEEIDTLRALLHEKVPFVEQLLALDEAGSRG